MSNKIVRFFFKFFGLLTIYELYQDRRSTSVVYCRCSKYTYSKNSFEKYLGNHHLPETSLQFMCMNDLDLLCYKNLYKVHLFFHFIIFYWIYLWSLYDIIALTFILILFILLKTKNVEFY